MITLGATLITAPIDKFLQGVERQLYMSLLDSLADLKEIAVQNLAALDAIDTLSLMESLYISAWRYSEYEDACFSAQEDYTDNPTKYPSIRAYKNGEPGGIPPAPNATDPYTGRDVQIDPEAKPESPQEGYMAVAAAHGKLIETGYVSWFGNDVPARPFIALTAEQGFSRVVENYQKAIDRALK